MSVETLPLTGGEFCPHCDSDGRSYTSDTRLGFIAGEPLRWRTRFCKDCGATWRTVEILLPPDGPKLVRG